MKFIPHLSLLLFLGAAHCFAAKSTESDDNVNLNKKLDIIMKIMEKTNQRLDELEATTTIHSEEIQELNQKSKLEGKSPHFFFQHNREKLT